MHYESKKNKTQGQRHRQIQQIDIITNVIAIAILRDIDHQHFIITETNLSYQTDVTLNLFTEALKKFHLQKHLKRSRIQESATTPHPPSAAP